MFTLDQESLVIKYLRARTPVFHTTFAQRSAQHGINELLMHQVCAALPMSCRELPMTATGPLDSVEDMFVRMSLHREDGLTSRVTGNIPPMWPYSNPSKLGYIPITSNSG